MEGSVPVWISAMGGVCVKTQMRDRRSRARVRASESGNYRFSVALSDSEACGHCLDSDGAWNRGSCLDCRRISCRSLDNAPRDPRKAHVLRRQCLVIEGCPYRKLYPTGAKPRITRCFCSWETFSN